jgi:hypothetical protein
MLFSLTVSVNDERNFNEIVNEIFTIIVAVVCDSFIDIDIYSVMLLLSNMGSDIFIIVIIIAIIDDTVCSKVVSKTLPIISLYSFLKPLTL